ncbi:MAG: CHASE3 domain-containing protein, partial [Flavobacteriales bacterium]|nr:CHASE3 domain-containing protein [Flavobacteriales bacterium]
MPLRSFSQDRSERRLALLLYVASFVLLLALLKATYGSMLRYTDTTAEARTLNLALLELESLLSDLRDQETATRGFILANDSAYLVPYNDALLRYGDHLRKVDSLLSRPHWRPFIGILHRRVEEVETGLFMMLTMNDRDGRMQPDEALWLERAKKAMDNTREAYRRLNAQLLVEREVLVERERAVGSDAPEMILFYSVMALLATAVLFWLLFKALRKKEVAKSNLQVKVAELAGEVRTRTSVQGILQKVLDTSPNSIMAFRAVRDAK